MKLNAKSPLVPLAALVAAVLVVGVIDPTFLSPHVLINLFADSATLFLMAIGLTFVIMIGSIDLSPQAVAALASVILAQLLPGWGYWAIPVALLAGIEFTSELAGVVWALAAAALWAGYILVGKRVADTHGGLDTLALGLSTAALILGPVIVLLQAQTNAAVFLDPRTWLLGVGVGLLSTAIPYALDQIVLRQVGQARFAILLALLPVTAAVIGLTVLDQIPSVGEIAGIGLVVAGLLLGARDAS